MITGYVFDLDGVITDTAKFHYQAWAQLAQDRLGITITPAVNELLKGRSRMDSLHAILQFGGQEGRYTDAELTALADVKNAQYRELIETITPADLLPGIPQLLADITALGAPMAIASASFNAPAIIARLGLGDVLTQIVDPGSVAHGKPAPDLFEAAAAMIASPAATTVAFEDASAGVAAIRAAGMFAVGIGAADLLAGADLIVPDTAALTLSRVQAAFAAAHAG
ncbi:beta-phosphoglucomutase [Lacticaseibacillus absianus]|uniref:beta-phosphoglucomutase n=1 Tax=Lacticaseibacillus absianus TaxID=2729623 RepID=UPI0015CD483F|nr:beta-phosphoglucomutase [Lacticaseibacillus absianus]